MHYRTPTFAAVGLSDMPTDSLSHPTHPSNKRRRYSQTAPSESTTATSSRAMTGACTPDRRQKRPRHSADTNASQDATLPTLIPRLGEPSSSKPTRARGHGDTPHSTRRDSVSKTEVKKEREARWRAWCEEHRWEPKDDPGYKQKVGSKEVHRSDGENFPSGCSLRAPRTGNGLLIHAPPVQP